MVANTLRHKFYLSYLHTELGEAPLKHPCRKMFVIALAKWLNIQLSYAQDWEIGTHRCLAKH